MITKEGMACGCCGVDRLGNGVDGLYRYSTKAVRCSRHIGRNPCAIEGCHRTGAAPIDESGFPCHYDDQLICAEHWRRLIPPRSRERRLYHAHFRRAKRQGWTEENRRAFWRYWDRLVAIARRRAAEGHLDIAEINRIMGWGDG